jgi:hypothetical protein
VNPTGLRLLFLVMLPKRDLLRMLMLPKRVPLQIYVQETLQKSARSFTVYLLEGAACLVSTHIPLLKLLLLMVVSIRRRLMIILIVWQLVAKSIKVIDKSDEAIEPHYQLILPTTEKYKWSPSVTGFAIQKRMRPGK